MINLQISGSLITLGWFASAPLTLLLAINRFFQMIFTEYVDQVFSAIKLKVVDLIYCININYLDLLCNLLVNQCSNSDTLLDTVHFSTVFAIFRRLALQWNIQEWRCHISISQFDHLLDARHYSIYNINLCYYHYFSLLSGTLYCLRKQLP